MKVNQLTTKNVFRAPRIGIRLIRTLIRVKMLSTSSWTHKSLTWWIRSKRQRVNRLFMTNFWWQKKFWRREEDHGRINQSLFTERKNFVWESNLVIQVQACDRMRVNQLTTRAAAGCWQSGEFCEARKLATKSDKVGIYKLRPSEGGQFSFES